MLEATIELSDESIPAAACGGAARSTLAVRAGKNVSLLKGSRQKPDSTLQP